MARKTRTFDEKARTVIQFTTFGLMLVAFSSLQFWHSLWLGIGLVVIVFLLGAGSYAFLPEMINHFRNREGK